MKETKKVNFGRKCEIFMHQLDPFVVEPMDKSTFFQPLTRSTSLLPWEQLLSCNNFRRLDLDKRQTIPQQELKKKKEDKCSFYLSLINKLLQSVHLNLCEDGVFSIREVSYCSQEEVALVQGLFQCFQGFRPLLQFEDSLADILSFFFQNFQLLFKILK